LKISAIDLGSGTIKFSAFEGSGQGWQALALDEANTELRKGMGEGRLLQAGPIAETLDAVEAFLARARALGIKQPPAYGTSALRKAANPEALLGPLQQRFGISAQVLSEQDEGRLNLLGSSGKARLAVDPGGDSSDCAWGPDWKTAATASLPFGSVSLQEKFGHEAPGGPIPQAALEGLKDWVKGQLDAFGPAAALKKSGMTPAIRMNAPVARALATFAGRAKERYELDDLRLLTAGMAAMPHEARAQLIAGEPVGKVDRTPFGFASWVALLEWMEAGTFFIEPWGIKLGAALALSHALEDPR
jgi:exopolyphosphatase/pppGpp-phosphohydrolase